MSDIDIDALVKRARDVRANAYAPYSNFKVGAVIVTQSGQLFVGCNVENASYGGAICAERSAILQMVAAGESEPVICVVITETDPPASPCGMCRQVLAEFASDMRIVLVGDTKKGEVRRETTLAYLLPDAFRLAV